MTIDEAIKHCEEVAEQQEADSFIDRWSDDDEWSESLKENCRQCAADHRQLAEWLRELKEAKRLLRLAVEDFNCDIDSICAICKHNDLVDGCPYIERYSECEYNWRYTAEALKLIGGSENDT
ncbi:hypothetical protein [Ruminococcus sp.]|uniref:hypothetical protein n=1 Tax=Ruminococcus sp. TaxID=41978 RepID=UPI001B719FDF|nr:hypothetical protein [Ruminococcus sp.]MBP5432212.1 hypothetical protein [Ruminococcus sp.]